MRAALNCEPTAPLKERELRVACKIGLGLSSALAGRKLERVVMEVSRILVEGAVVVVPVGRIDESSWGAFGAELEGAIEEAARVARQVVIVDLSAVDYMSSRGLRVLTMAKQQGRGYGVAIRLAAPNDMIREILAISRYDQLFDVDDALPTLS
jgi:anti-anti-sigma factor